MKVICDTTPFIALSSIGRIHLLKEIYSSIIVPRAIIEEINEGGKINVPDLSSFDWIKVIPLFRTEVQEGLYKNKYGTGVAPANRTGVMFLAIKKDHI